MKSSEFINEETVVDIQLREMAEMFNVDDARTMFESAGNHQEITDFINRAETIGPLSELDIGKSFFPCNLIIIPPHSFMSISRFTDHAYLIEITPDDKYVFRRELTKQTFPATNQNALIFRLIFSTISEFQDFEMMLKIKFSEWNITDKIL